MLKADGVKPGTLAKIASMVPPDDYAGMGQLLELRAVGDDGMQTQLRYSKDKPRVCCDPAGTQIYFVGGDQGSEKLSGRFVGFDLVDLGECTYIAYFTRKQFDNFEPIEYYHEFGEENGIRPHLAWSPARKQMYLVGGNYAIRPEGIVN